MAVFFDLGRQRAAAGRAAIAGDGTLGLHQHRIGQPVPLHSRVALRIARIKQFTVFYVQQALHQNWRDIVKALVNPLRIALLKQAVLVTIKDAQTALGLLKVGSEITGVDNFCHAL